MIILHNYVLYYIYLIDKDIAAWRHVMCKCLNAVKDEILYSIVYKWNKRHDLFSLGSVLSIEDRD